MKIFNQLDFSKEISNLEILENNIVNKNFAKNSILVRIFDVKNETFLEISFAKGKKVRNGNNSLFKIMQGYKSNSNKKSVYNLGIPIHHFFWVRKYDLNSGELLNKKYCHYYEIVNILELNNKYNLVIASKQKDKNKNIEELRKIKKEYEKMKIWYENEYSHENKQKQNSIKKKEDLNIEKDIGFNSNVSSNLIIQNIFED
ncbi:hypothetical protein [Spiroplasma endosymbiont of Atherix ibis]|uniref:hypothetical protein n=1 Tax=Spiroplasma endosymbiont of Atherix ibis TaxID=3066291 RepID=UPI0030D07FF1